MTNGKAKSILQKGKTTGIVVPCGQLRDVIATLGCTQEEFCRVLGISNASLSKYLRLGVAPAIVMTAANGIMAEFRQGGTGQIKNLPAIIPPKPVRMPPKPKHREMFGRHVVLTIKTPASDEPRTQALLAACGYTVLSRSVEE